MATDSSAPHSAGRPSAGIPLFSTYVHPRAAEQVAAVLATTMLSEGRLVKQFEQQLTAECGLRHPAAVNSGTSALHLALEVAGVGPGDEVILPAQTFVASGTSILQTGAVPIFADICYSDGNLDPADIEHRITRRTKAIMPVHWGGYPCDLAEIGAVAARHGLVVVEDAAHALGATYRGQPIGAISDYTCFSFQAIKHLTTGDGGAVCALDPAKAEEVLHRRWFGIDRAHSPMSELGEREYDLRQLGYKYHLSDYAAALGLANMAGLHERMQRRRAIARRYRAELRDVPGLTHFEYRADRESAYWLFGFHVERRLDFIRSLKAAGITASVVHVGIDHNTLFGGRRPALSNQRRFDDTQVHIPLHDALTDGDVDHIIAVIKQGW
ncbi:DegT/DnrJ/EryC1/StrS family aminotransferase [Hymenobacter jeollabukensis]|uniref:DegT/DnrJ/EryC1/StrS family aminotransferase n=1 Tax=Hymenobacter jeollabukensis TaxID=2025313 RepID=A0A5R8WRD2_9BACT|nr:DegT/DnrJ/EryC1/StrS family aminotransferase [Hymenobacter jeollabukensis]TLM93256.1 DegT/DnrJ/EryC1/StrS family aminotransferase [Hymenobacter jeollabukensis]